MTTPLPSLRERSKAKRRRAIQRAALQLFGERGYDGATIADIADAAEVAPRTVSMYFPTKFDIAMSLSNDLADRLTSAFDRFPELSFSDVVDRWIVAEIESAEPDFAAVVSAMYAANPALRAASTNNIDRAADVGGAALVAETGLAPEDPMVQIVAAAVGAALTRYLTAALQAPSTRDGHESFMRYLRAIINAARPV